jgi:hypothetical protein
MMRGRKNMKTRCQMRLTWSRKTIGDSSDVLGITRGAKEEGLGPRREYKTQYNQKYC